MGVHTIFKPHLLKDKLPHGKIEAIAAYYNRVMIGTADGSLLLYVVCNPRCRALRRSVLAHSKMRKRPNNFNEVWARCSLFIFMCIRPTA